VKNNSKKNKNMFPVDTSSISSIDSKNYVTPELAVLNQLIVEFGFEKVLDSLCKGKLNHKNKIIKLQNTLYIQKSDSIFSF